jgi:hypothetical protein
MAEVQPSLSAEWTEQVSLNLLEISFMQNVMCLSRDEFIVAEDANYNYYELMGCEGDLPPMDDGQ